MLTGLADYIRRHHLGLIAIFIALGGSAYAASKAGSGDIAKNAIKAKHIKTGQVGTSEVKDESLTGDDIQQDTLGALLVGGPEDALVDRFGEPNPNSLGAGGGGDCTVGEIELWAGRYPENSRAPADGKIISIGSNTALYQKIGNEFGGKDTDSTFAYPDLRAVAPDKTLYTICTVGTF